MILLPPLQVSNLCNDKFPNVSASTLIEGIIFHVLGTPKRKCLDTSEANSTILWRYAADIGVPHCQTPRRALRSVDLLKNTIFQQRKIIATLKKKVTRRDRQILNMKGILGHLKKKNFLSSETSQHVLVCVS